MAKSPEDRYADMSKLADDLRLWLKGGMVAPAHNIIRPLRESEKPRASKPAKRLFRAPLWIGIGGAAGVITIGAFLLALNSGGERGKPVGSDEVRSDADQRNAVDQRNHLHNTSSQGQQAHRKQDRASLPSTKTSPPFAKTSPPSAKPLPQPPRRTESPVDPSLDQSSVPFTKRTVRNRLTVNGQEVVWRDAGQIQVGRIDDKYFARIPPSAAGDIFPLPDTAQFRALSAIRLMNGRPVEMRRDGNGNLVLRLPKSQRSRALPTTVMIQLQ